jgi:hypothetical protein
MMVFLLAPGSHRAFSFLRVTGGGDALGGQGQALGPSRRCAHDLVHMCGDCLGLLSRALDNDLVVNVQNDAI